MQLDPRIVDVLLSRLLHDLIGPVTATVNGIELVEEFGPTESAGLGREALDLVGDSARQTADRLGLFRMAFGAAGNASSSKFEQIEALAKPYLATRRIGFESMDAPLDLEQAPVGIVKATLATVFLLADCLPKGGRVSAEMVLEPRPVVRLAAIGDGARLDPDCAACLSGPVDPEAETTRSVIATMARFTAARFGFRIDARVEDDRVLIELLASD